MDDKAMVGTIYANLPGPPDRARCCTLAWPTLKRSTIPQNNSHTITSAHIL